MSSKSVQPSLFEPDTLMQAAELQVLRDEYKRALQEPPWDGNVVCGALVARLGLPLRLSM